MKDITVYSRPMCESCDRLKQFLKKKGIEFQEIDGMSAKGLSSLRCGGCFPQYFPVLQVGEVFYEYASLFGEHDELLDLTEILK